MVMEETKESQCGCESDWSSSWVTPYLHVPKLKEKLILSDEVEEKILLVLPGSVKVVINRYFKYSKNKTQRRIMKNEFESSIQ